MKFIFVICLLLLASCNSTPPASQSNVSIVETYYDGLNASNFERVRSVLADSFSLIEGDYTNTMAADDYYIMFQWDSVFTPQNSLSNIEATQNKVTALVTATSPRYTFLEHNPYTCETTFTFESGKIISLETGECPNANWPLWESKRDTLVAWINANHPDLSGFIHDLTKAGAENYMKAIHLYENR